LRAAVWQQVDTTTSSLTVTNTNLPTGTSPVAVAFDGVFVWAIDGSSSNVFKVLPSTTPGQPGTQYGPFINPGGSSSFLGFDGGNMWVSTTNASNNTYSLPKM
jgi:DNA-binding beta-propeller fold protein YncE